MNRVIIIAEAGVNHNGSTDIAKQLILKACEAGVDYVKFQTSKSASTVTSKFAEMADYQKTNLCKEESQLEMLKSFVLSFDEYAPRSTSPFIFPSIAAGKTSGSLS